MVIVMNYLAKNALKYYRKETGIYNYSYFGFSHWLYREYKVVWYVTYPHRIIFKNKELEMLFKLKFS